MKRTLTRRLMTAVLCVLITAMLSTAVLAAYVPVECKKTGTDIPFTIQFSYKKNGNLTKYTELYTDSAYSRTYKWKSGRISKVTTVDTDNDVTTKVYKYKKGVLSSITTSYSWSTGYKESYKWKKKTGTVTTTYADGSTSTSVVTVKRNAKKRITSVTTQSGNSVNTVTTKYYKNGNIKSITDAEDGYTTIYNYNKNGYETSIIRNWSGGIDKTTFTYTMNKKKKCPKSVTVTTAYSGDDPFTETYEFTRFKKVKQVRNCDAVGTEIPLGVSFMY